MGHVNREHGRISIETKRGVGFIIHAGYGYRLKVCKLRDVAPGKKFNKGGRLYRLIAQKAHVATIRDLDSGWEGDWSTSADVALPDTEVFDEELPLARTWKEAHPEFLAEDIDDLIAALQEAKGHL